MANTTLFYRHCTTEITPLSFVYCLFRGSERVEFLLPLVAGFGNNHNSLDTVSNLNATKSEWVLVYGSSKLSVLRQTDMHKKWTYKSPPIHRYRPAYHYVTTDSITILLYYISAANIITRKLFELLKSSYISESSNISLKYFFACHSQPALGHFNDDGILDLFFQHSANGIMKVKQIVHLGVFFKAQTNARAHTLHQSAALF